MTTIILDSVPRALIRLLVDTVFFNIGYISLAPQLFSHRKLVFTLIFELFDKSII